MQAQPLLILAQHQHVANTSEQALEEFLWPEKNEIDPMILKSAAMVVADRHTAVPAARRDPCGDSGWCLETGGRRRSWRCHFRKGGPRSPDDITVADLTGVAVQDIMIAKAVVARTNR